MKKLSSVLLGSFALAVGWPAIPVVSAAPRTVARTVEAGGLTAWRAPIRFNLVAASWVDRRVDDAQVRTSLDGVSWTPWQLLEADGAESPDTRLREGRRDARYSAPVWVGDARFVQLRGAPAARLHLVNVKGDADDPSPPERALRAVGRWATGTTPAAAAGSGPVGAFTRAQWGADERIREQTPPSYASSVKAAVVHHTVGTNSYSPGESAAIIRAIYYYHVKSRGFRDIAYNFLVDRYGQIFEGRWGGMDRPVIGAHTGGFNAGTTGVAMLGDFSSASPTTANVDGVARILSWKFTVHQIRPLGYTSLTAAEGDGARWPPGTTIPSRTVVAHRDLSFTSCNGQYGYARMQEIREKIVLKRLPAGSFVRVGSTVYRMTATGRLAVPAAAIFDSHAYSGEPVGISAAEVSALPVQGSLPYRDGILLQGDTSPSVYVVSAGTLRQFQSRADFLAMGFSDSRVVKVTTSLLSQFKLGAPVERGKYPDGIVLRSSAGGGTFLIHGGKRRGMFGGVIGSWRFTSADIVTVQSATFNAIGEGALLGFRDGWLVSGSNSNIYIVSEGKRRVFATGIFSRFGYCSCNVHEVSDTLVALNPPGDMVNGR